MGAMSAAAPIVMFHAHPDDEAIFTGGTMPMLADAGHDVILLLATSGEAGAVRPGTGAPVDLGVHRRQETDEAADLLGVSEVIHLGYGDSGAHGESPGFAAVPLEEASTAVARTLDRLGAGSLVVYDEVGIYGHPDHLAVHRVGMAAASRVGLDLVYETTVDREYLHFVETHVVVEAGLPDHPADLGLAATSLGSPTVLIDTTVDVTSVLDIKRGAMAAHGSQIPDSSTAMRLPVGDFSSVYGFEWYRRHGPPGPIERLAQA
jgi:LmbE family N-acetylglucosaminyl deacetylase